MNFWHPIKEYRERKQKRIEEILDAVWELEQKLKNPSQATYLAHALIKFRKQNPEADYEIIMGTEDELKKKGHNEYKQYTHIGQRFVSPRLSSEKIWEMQRDRRRFNPGLDSALTNYEDVIEASLLARDVYEPLYGVIAPKAEDKEQLLPERINHGKPKDEPFDYR